MKLGCLAVEHSHVLLCEIVRVSADGLYIESWKFVRVVPRREKFYFILFHFILCISYMLLALQGTAGYISQSNKQEGQITCHSHSNSKPVETAENCC